VLPAVFVLAALFVLLFAARLGGAKRADWLPRWPALVFAAAAIIALFRGAVAPAVALSVLAALSWYFWPQLTKLRKAQSAPHPDVEEVEARAILGVGPNATEAEIRAAYRQRMRRAHPDRGGNHADAARLTVARDRLVRRRRG
jgi:hypothetical protein